jgi:predicted O-methyltransferase YrrM
MSDRTADAYRAAFEAERAQGYPAMDQLEARLGYCVDRRRLEAAARVLACPLKKNPPNWQHGRLIYAMGRHYLRICGNEEQTWLDIGTAKGFSACVMSWALEDAGVPGDVASYDIIAPHSREPRNSVADGQTVHEFVAPFRAPGVLMTFHLADSLRAFPAQSRINFAFIDGSHTYEGVRSDIEIVTARQQPGDVILFDDMQVPGVRRAVHEPWSALYSVEEIELLPKRRYAIVVRQ